MKKPNEKKTYRPITRPENGENNFTERVFAFVDYQRLVTSGAMDKNCKCYTNALYALSDSLVSCVLKKIYGSSCNETIRKMRAERDKHILDNLSYASNNSREKGYNRDGEPIEIVKDSELDKSIKTLIGEGVSSRFDLVQNTVLAILETVSRLTPEEIMRDELWTPEEPEEETEPDGEPEEIYVNFMTKQITQKRLNRRVYITDFLTQSDKTRDDQIKTITVETTELQSLCKNIRAYITDENRPSENPQKFYYINHTIETEDGETVSVYERFIPSVEFNFNGLESRPRTIEIDPDIEPVKLPLVKTPEELQNMTIKITSGELAILPLNSKLAYTSFETLVNKLGLTETQQKILAYRLKSSGVYGSKAIASATGKSLNTVKSAIREIRRKMYDSGLTAETDVYIDRLETHSFNDVKAKYIESGIMPEPPKDGLRRPIPNIKFTTLDIPHRPEPEIKKTMKNRTLGVYAIDKTRYQRAAKNYMIDRESDPEKTRYIEIPDHITDFTVNLDFEPIDISVICDPERPTAKSETENKPSLYRADMTQYVRESLEIDKKNSESEKDKKSKETEPERPRKCLLVSVPDPEENKKKRPWIKTQYEREIIAMYLPPRKNS